MAGAGCICAVLGFTMSPTSQMAEPSDFNWFAAGTALILFAVYLLVDGAVAFEKARD
jgi:hypothetical protein